TLEAIGGIAVNGYRAASFSIGSGNQWAFAILEEEGYAYSSSVYPVRHDLYGMREAPRFPFHPIAGHAFREFPITSVLRLGRNSAGGDPPRSRPCPPGLHLLFPPLGDPSRAAPPAWPLAEEPFSPLHQSRSH